MNFKLISVDIFQTLVDVSSINDSLWKTFLGDAFTPELSQIGWELASDKIIDYFSNHIAENKTFVTVKSIFAKCYSDVFQEMDLDFEPDEAARIAAHHHNLATPFVDSEEFLAYIQDRYTYCISSDADNDMIEGLTIIENSDKMFISENLRTYKMSDENEFFRTVLTYYNIQPHEMIHIGDSAADIVNPKRLGIKTCWINRDQADWQYDIEPDYIFADLRALTQIL